MSKASVGHSAYEGAARLAIVQSVVKILWRSVAVVALTELAVMLLLRATGEPITVWTSLLDTLVLASIALPTLYVVILRPVAQLAAEHAAGAAESRFQAIAQSVQDGIVISSWDQKIRFANQAAEKMFGFPTGVLQGRELEELVPPEYVQRHRQGMARYRATGEPHLIGKGLVELEGQRHGAERFPIEFSLNELSLPGEKSFVAVIRDITERRQAEAALRQAEEKYRSIFNDATLGIFQTTPDGRYFGVNPAMAQMYGFASPEELMSSRTDIARQVYVHPEEREEFRRRIEQEGVVEGFEYEAYRKDGSHIWLRGNARAVRGASGQILHYVGTVEDVTVSKRAEQALVESEAKLRKILEALPVAVRIVRGEEIVYANPADARLHGYASPLDEIGVAFYQHVVPEERDDVWDIIRRQELGQPAPKRYQVRRRRADGSEFHAECTVEIVEYEGQKARLNVIEDLTDRERLSLFEMLLPVCCVCGKIRNDEGVEHGKGGWERLDRYVASHSDAKLSHTFCPECLVQFRKEQGLE